MSRINSNINSLIAQRILTQNNKQLTTTLERLSTGYQINRGADDPAGLIASEKLRVDKAGIASGLNNAQRADQIVNIAEGGLQEISSLLTELQSLVGDTSNDAGLSTEEKAANQDQVDQILQTIDRIASTTSFQGTKLLNGAYDFDVTSVNAGVSDYTIKGATIDNANVKVNVIITASAQQAGLYLSTGGTLDLTASSDRVVFELAGNKGSKEFSFASGTTLADVVTSVNAFKSVTGVSAATLAATAGTGVVFKSTAFGSEQYVSLNIKDDGNLTGNVVTLSSTNENVVSTTAGNRTALTAVTAAIKDTGQDIGAIVNGVTARGTGKTLSVSNQALNLSLTLTTAAARTIGSLGGASGALTITGGGAKFNIGPTVDVGNQVRLGIGNVAARELGAATVSGAIYNLDDLGSGGLLNLVDGNLEGAQSVVSKAVDSVSSLRGSLGAFQKFTIGSTINALGVALENTSAAESAIRDTDFAQATADLTRSQILVQAASSVLSISNAQPQNVLKLL
ncbi:MAG: flagellin [Phycisphaera sp.]|nr:flagellin [Phycisphaera sp.]